MVSTRSKSNSLQLFMSFTFTMFEKDCLVSFVAVTCLKFLFIPLYKSTDFEVHRNWMAITYQTKMKDWYIEETSQWTLDYPPLFAWFEFGLAHIAKYFDKRMLSLTNFNYDSLQTIFFMRLSVIVSDVVYFYGVNKIYKLTKDRKLSTDDPWIRKEVILAMLLLWNPGLLLVDHIHFQYNGFLNGIFLISISHMFEDNFLASAFWYTVLINFKHIYVYLAPAYFIFLLKNYCFTSTSPDGTVNLNGFSFFRLLKLAAIGIVTCVFSFGPFIYMGQMKQVLSRLFPVKRGLTHSYWAPNIWALYNLADRILSTLAYKLNIYKNYGEMKTCSTKGLVQECEHVVLPSINPGITIFLALLSISPVFWIVWRQPKSPKVFIHSIVLCSFGSFLFGYHVHEKAILMILLPLTISAVGYKEEAKLYTFLSVIGHFSLFPLLHREGETLIKILLLLLHSVYVFSSLSQLHDVQSSMVSILEKVYLLGVFVLQIFYSFGMKLLNLEDKLPFLPLMLISTYCALGVVYSWIKYCYLAFEIKDTATHTPKKKL